MKSTPNSYLSKILCEHKERPCILNGWLQKEASLEEQRVWMRKGEECLERLRRSMQRCRTLWREAQRWPHTGLELRGTACGCLAGEREPGGGRLEADRLNESSVEVSEPFSARCSSLCSHQGTPADSPIGGRHELDDSAGAVAIGESVLGSRDDGHSFSFTPRANTPKPPFLTLREPPPREMSSWLGMYQR